MFPKNEDSQKTCTHHIRHSTQAALPSWNCGLQLEHSELHLHLFLCEADELPLDICKQYILDVTVVNLLANRHLQSYAKPLLKYYH